MNWKLRGVWLAVIVKATRRDIHSGSIYEEWVAQTVKVAAVFGVVDIVFEVHLRTETGN